jgi:YVTN family beta-propeller protein
MSAVSGLGRVRWAAIGAALAVSLGAGGMGIVNATISSGSKAVYVPIAPCRLADTRPAPDTVGPKNTPIGPGLTHTFTVRGSNGNCSIPAGATAIVANVTAVGPTAQSFMTIWPADKPQPNASSLNYSAGQAPFPNAVTVTLSGDGKIKVANKNGSVNVIIDIAGYYEDHNHDDRYDTKAQVDAKVVERTTRLTDAQIATMRWDQDPGRPSTVTIGSSPWGVAFDGTSIWASNFGSGTVSKIDPATNTVVATVTVGGNPSGLAFDGTNLWVANESANSVSKINPATNAVTATVAVGLNPYGVAFDGTSIWVTNTGSASISKIDPATDAVMASVDVGLSFPWGLAFDGTSVWVANHGSNSVSKINPITNDVTATIPVGLSPIGVAFDGTSIWVTNAVSASVSKINPATNTVSATVAVGANPNGVAFDGTSIWVANQSSANVSKVNPSTNTETDTVVVGSNPYGVAFDGTNIWVINYSSNSVSKIIPF